MANTQAMCTTFMEELLEGVHNFTTGTGNTFKAALYEATANTSSSTTLCASVTAYATTVNTIPEVSGTNYVAGGVTVTNGTSPLATNTSVTAGVAYWTPSASLVYTNVTLTTAFDAVLIYNSSASNKAVSVHTFGSQTVTAGTFTLTMPVNATTTGLLRLSTT